MSNKTIKTSLIVLAFAECIVAQSPFKTFVGKDCYQGLENEKTGEVLPAQYSSIEVEAIGNDWLIAAKNRQENTYFLYQNNKKIDLPYPEVTGINDQLLRVGTTNQYGLVNTEGQGIALLQYQSLEAAGTAFIISQYKNKYGVLAVDGKTVLPNQYEAIKYWVADLFWAKKEGSWQLFNPNGKRIGTEEYDAVRVFEHDAEWAIVKQKGKWAIIDKNSELQTKFDYQNINLLSPQWLALRKANKWTFVNREIKPIVDDKFEGIGVLSTSKVSVTKDGKQGVLDVDKGMLLEPIYGNIGFLGTDVVIVGENMEPSLSKNDVLRLFDCTTQKMGEEVFDFVPFWNSTGAAAGVYIWVKKKGKYGLVDKTSKWIIEAKYRMIQLLSEDYVRVENEERKQGVFNRKGELVIPLEYDVIIRQNHLFKVKKDNKNEWFYINEKNQKLPCTFLE